MINSQSLPDGTYYIKSGTYGTYWDLCASNSLCGDQQYGNIYIHEPFNDVWQRFIVTKLPNGYYTIQSQDNGLFATALDSNVPADTIFLTPESGANDQQWNLIPRGDNTFIIKPRSYPTLAVAAPPDTDVDIYLEPKDCKTSLQYYIFEVIQGESNGGMMSLMKAGPKVVRDGSSAK